MRETTWTRGATVLDDVVCALIEDHTTFCLKISSSASQMDTCMEEITWHAQLVAHNLADVQQLAALVVRGSETNYLTPVLLYIAEVGLFLGHRPTSNLQKLPAPSNVVPGGSRAMVASAIHLFIPHAMVRCRQMTVDVCRKSKRQLCMRSVQLVSTSRRHPRP